MKQPTKTVPARAPTAGAALSPLELAGAWLLALFIAAGTWLLVTAQLAALVGSGNLADVPASRMGRITFEILQRPGDPAGVFPGEAAAHLPGPLAFWSVAAVVASLLLLSAGWFLLRRMKRSSKPEDGAKWAEAKDVKPLAVRSPVPGRLTLGYGPGGLLAAEPGHSLLVMGPTQSGKTSSLAVPAILEWPGPVVATSVKVDLLEDTAEVRTSKGDVWVYDPSGSTRGFDRASWTPLAGCDTWRGALRTAAWMAQAARDRQMGENDFWYSNAAKLLAPLLFAARTALGGTIQDVVRWVDLRERGEVELLLKCTGVPEALAAAKATWNRNERTRSSVYTTSETVLAAYADPSVAASAQRSDVDPDRLLDGGAHTLYISAPLHEQARLRPVFTALVESVLAAAYEHAAQNGRLDPGLLLVLDEAANIAPLRDLAQIASTAAGLGIQLVTIWQDRAQIVHRYAHAASTVVNNHRAKLLLSGITDGETTRELSQIIGETEVSRRSTTVDADGRTSATHATHTQPLASAAGLRQLRPFEGVLVYGHLPPARMRLRPWFENPEWSTSRKRLR